MLLYGESFSDEIVKIVHHSREKISKFGVGFGENSIDSTLRFEGKLIGTTLTSSGGRTF